MKSHQAFKVPCTVMKSEKFEKHCWPISFVYWWTVELKLRNLNDLESSSLTWFTPVIFWTTESDAGNWFTCNSWIRLVSRFPLQPSISTSKLTLFTDYMTTKFEFLAVQVGNYDRYLQFNPSTSVLHTGPQPADISRWVREKNDCNLLYLTTKHAFENFGGGSNCLVITWLHNFLIWDCSPSI